MTSTGCTRRLFLSSIAATATLTALPAWAQLQVDILGVGANQYPIAVQAFQGGNACPEDISKIIGDDLTRSGLFRLASVDATAPGVEDTPNWSALTATGANADVVGEVSKIADGRWNIQYKLYDVVKKQELLNGSDLTPEGDLRLEAHKIADRIFEKITGMQGDFSSQIAYVRQSGPKSYQIMIADSDGFNPKQALTSRAPIISISRAPTGDRIAYTSLEAGNPEVFVQNINTGARHKVAGFRGNNSAPAWSPDGGTLAVALSKDGVTKIYLMSAGGGAARKFTDGDSIDTEPTFSPDGKYIYFVSDRGGNPQIYRQAVGGGRAERISFGNAYAVSPTVSSSNHEVAYIVRANGNFQLVQQDLSTGNVIPLSQFGKNESPSYSPNGNMIVFATDVGGQGVLSIVSSDGSIRSRLSGLKGDIREPAWGPPHK
ncbi:MAG: Tol-Pal system beta propeller repeat protein TolB [Burkholderiales bacterium]|nr:Tol-Pal system beta propeller repeat protein TolB [Burkholderiales bacterium]